MREFIEQSSFFGITVSFVLYTFLCFVKKKFKISTPFFNPLLISSVLIIVFLLLFNIDYEIFECTNCHVDYWITPMTICLAVPLYRHIEELKNNIAAIVIGITSGCIAHALVIIFLSRLLHLDEGLFLSVMPKSVTTAVALGLSENIGGITSVTIVGVSIAGLSGAVIGPFVLKLFKIKNPVSRGLSLGTASHAVGTSKAMELGETEGAMSSLAIVVTAILTVIVVPILLKLVE